jgi:DegV family protein with EDD domain
MSNHAKRIAVITDSTCDIPPDLVEKYHIHIVPQYLIWGTEELRDGFDIDNKTFYSRLPNDPIHPKTSQPNPPDFAHYIQESGAEEAVIITISNQLSKTVDSANGARELVDVPVHVLDSLSVSMGLGFQVLAAARVRDNGGSPEEMIAAAQAVHDTLSVLLTVDTLEYLHKGGRIGGAAKLFGTALQLKPLLEVNSASGRIEAVERIRTRQKALQGIASTTFERVDPGRPMKVAVMHGAALDDAQALYEEVKARYHPGSLIIGEVSPIIGVHAGPGVIGLIAYNE